MRLYLFVDGDRFEGKWHGNYRVSGILITSKGRVSQIWDEKNLNRGEIKSIVLRKYPDDNVMDCMEL
jgi:hypothetical protein